MPRALQTWTVFPHGPIEKVAENLWRVPARMPGAPFDRVMVVARLRDGRLVVHNAIALAEADMSELERWGVPSFLIVPNGRHRMDAKIYKTRYPGLRVVAPPGAQGRVEQIVGVDATGDALEDDTIRYEILAGVGDREGVVEVRSQAGVTLVFADAIMNQQKLPGFAGFMMSLFGFTGPAPKVSAPSRMALVKDKRALRAHLEKLAATEGLVRIEVGHGAPITSAPAEALRAAASSL